MESWRKVFRSGFVPQLSDAALTALRTALLTDDPRLLQGATTMPPPVQCVQDWDCEAACPVGFCGWRGEGITAVGEVEQFFAHACFEADLALAEPAACRYFLQWWDDTPRNEARPQLLYEVNRALALRQKQEEGQPCAG